jgi:chitinase
MIAMRVTVLVLFAGLLFSCTDDDERKQTLVGNWHGTAWLINGAPSSLNAEEVTFSFRDDDTYSSSFGLQSMQGTYRIKGEKLYTTEEGKEEIVVGIRTLTMDSLVFDMNRGGQDETLILLRDGL